jgi:hypothetical protein
MMTSYPFPVNSDRLICALKLWDFKYLQLTCVNE